MTFAQPFHEYEVLDRVGSGSMGTVFKARHKKLNRIVALKVLKPSLARDTRYVDRLRREARIVASLNHPNIVTGYDLGQEDGYHFFVMEFVEGKSLRELLHEWGMFSEDRVLDVAIQITIALDHAFKKGVIHRDIKPGNILIDENNVVKLTDMGLAKGPDNLAITRDGATVGTPQYISPEQAKSPQDVDIRSDLYSLGATLFHMCTGQPPFRAETMANVLVKVLEERAPSAVGFNPDLSDGLNLIIRKLLSKRPDRRYQTPADLLADLLRVQRSERPEVDLEELDTGEEDGRRRVAFVAAGAFLLIGTTAAFSYWYLNRDGDEPVVVKAEPRGEYRKELEARLRGHEKIGDKLSHLARLVAVAEKDYQREVLLEQKKRWEQALADQLPTLMRAENKRFATTFEGLRWTDTKDDMRRHLADRIDEEFRVEVSKLPVAAGREYQFGWTGIERLLEQHIDTRESRYRTAVNDYIQRLTAKVRDTLRIGDIAEADRELRDGLRVSAFGAPLGSPPVEQLPDGLRQHVETAIASARSVADKELLAREGDWVQKFAEAQQNGVAEVRELLVAGKPLRAADKLSRLERELRDDFPPAHFRAGADPWVEAAAVLRRTASDVADHRVRATREEFKQALAIAYELFARRGDHDVATKTLALYSPNADPKRLQAHADLLKQASRVRELLLERLLPARSSSRRIRVPLARGDKPVQVDVVRRGSSVVFKHGKSEVSLALLKVPALCDQAGGGFAERLSDELRAGLALWYVLSGEGKAVDSAIAALIAEPRRELFQQDILGLEVRPKAPDALLAQDRLESIRSKIASSRWLEADAELAQLRTAHSEFAKEWAQQLSVIERRIDDGKKRQVLLRRLLAKRRPAGMTVAVDKELNVRVGLDIRKTKFALVDRVGWQHEASQPVHYPRRGVSLKTARKQSLVIPTLLSVDEPVRATLTLSFPEEGDHPRLLFVDCHGATIGLGLTRSGNVAAVQVDRGLAASGAVEAFKRAAHKALKAAELQAVAHVVPGAQHRFELLVRKKSGSRQTVVVSVLLESVELGRLEFRRQPTARPELTLTPMSPVTLHAIALHGRG